MKKLKLTKRYPLAALLNSVLGVYFLLISTDLTGQKLTYFDDIQPIIERNCVACHRIGQVAPFPLTTYDDVAKRGKFIAYVTAERYMPPNPTASGSNSHFKNVKKLTDSDIRKISRWVAEGKAKGKAKAVKSLENSQNTDLSRDNREGVLSAKKFREPDLILTFRQPFKIEGSAREQFRVFVVPTNTTEDLYIEGIDFLPENRKVAHHCRFTLDTTNQLRADDGIEVGATSEFQRLGVKMNDNFFHGWLPGNTAIFYPEGTAKRLPKNSDIILNMHYSPTLKTLTESPKILLYLTKTPPKRLVKTFILDENWISNQPFSIPKDTVIKFYVRSPMLPNDISLISITPHMHFLGKSFRAYAITPDGDLIDLIKIDAWDFNWQMTYQFDILKKIPRGSTVYAEATYDNTTANAKNPFSPPQQVTYGWGTKNEMMNLILQYVD